MEHERIDESNSHIGEDLDVTNILDFHLKEVLDIVGKSTIKERNESEDVEANESLNKQTSGGDATFSVGHEKPEEFSRPSILRNTSNAPEIFGSQIEIIEQPHHYMVLSKFDTVMQDEYPSHQSGTRSHDECGNDLKAVETEEVEKLTHSTTNDDTYTMSRDTTQSFDHWAYGLDEMIEKYSKPHIKYDIGEEDFVPEDLTSPALQATIQKFRLVSDRGYVILNSKDDLRRVTNFLREEFQLSLRNIIFDEHMKEIKRINHLKRAGLISKDVSLKRRRSTRYIDDIRLDSTWDVRPEDFQKRCKIVYPIHTRRSAVLDMKSSSESNRKFKGIIKKVVNLIARIRSMRAIRQKLKRYHEDRIQQYIIDFMPDAIDYLKEENVEVKPMKVQTDVSDTKTKDFGVRKKRYYRILRHRQSKDQEKDLSVKSVETKKAKRSDVELKIRDDKTVAKLSDKEIQDILDEPQFRKWEELYSKHPEFPFFGYINVFRKSEMNEFLEN